MKSLPIGIALILAFLPADLARAADQPADPTPDAEAEGYETRLLEDGATALQGPGGGPPTVHEGILSLAQGQRLATHHRYRDFTLTFDWRPAAGKPPAGSIAFGLDACGGADNREGDARPSEQVIELAKMSEENSGDAADSARIKSGDWNRVQLCVSGGSAEATINGRCCWRADDLKILPGKLEFRAPEAGSGPLELSDLRIVELGYRSLFNGHDLSGWEGAGRQAADCWAVRDGVLLCTGEKGPWLRSSEQFGDFNLRLEYQINPGGNSGVYVRVPASGNHHGQDSGIEVQILDDAADRYKNLRDYQFTGSLYAIVAAEPRTGLPPGTWNTLEIDCSAQAYSVWHNGCQVVGASADGVPQLAERLVHGHLGLQNHQEEVYFRHLRIGPSQGFTAKPPAQAPAADPEDAEPQPIALFNGQNLDGWSVKCRAADRDKHYWRAAEGAIVAEVPAGSDHHYIWLLTDREFTDFDLRLKVQTDAASTGNSGVQVRSRYDDQNSWLDGPQVDLHPPGPWRSGFIYDETRGAQVWLWPDVGSPANAKPEHAPAGWKWQHAGDADLWNDVQIVCRGLRIKTIINGVQVADYDGAGRLDDDAHRARKVGLKGHIGLQIHPGGTLRIRFKDLQLQELPPASSKAEPEPLGVAPSFGQS